MKVMVDLVCVMKWNYVIILVFNSEYGWLGIEVFKYVFVSFGNSYDVCILVDERFIKWLID